MNGKDFEHRPNKRGRKCEEVDRISELPDETITHILSFLPLKEAVATSILSTRWSSLWKYTPNLVFVNAEWVNLILKSYKALSLKQFTISFYVHRKTFHQVSKWLHFAFSRRVESLKLNFEGAHVVLDVNMLNSSIQSSGCKFLKELTLGKLNVSGEAIEWFQRNCPLLEGLIMKKATLTSDLVVSGTLKYLEIDSRKSHGVSIKVSAPNLTRLMHRCKFDLKRLSLANVPNLVEASYSLFGSEHITHHLANVAANLEILTITLHRPTVFRVPQMPKLKKFVVDYTLENKKIMLPVACVLHESPCLEEFKIGISDLNMYFFMPVPPSTRHRRFQHHHLKVFEISGFSDDAPDHAELVIYIANNCIALEKIIVTPIYPSVARQLLQRVASQREVVDPFLYRVDVIAGEQKASEMKKYTDGMLVGKVPDHIKLYIN